MVIRVELGKSGAEVHRRIMINAGDAVLSFLDLEFVLSHISFFPCDKHEKSPKKIGQLWDAVTSSKP
jgi:cyanophycinase-like exopeptidase